jgi:hypothetical protein
MELLEPIEIGYLVISLLIFFGIRALFLRSCQQLLMEVSPENRQMTPGLVWVGMIPFVNFVWNFIMASRIANSLEAELRKRNLHQPGSRPTYNAGMAYGLLSVLSIIPFFGTMAALGSLTAWIVYWIQLYQYKNILQKNPYLEGDLLKGF